MPRKKPDERIRLVPLLTVDDVCALLGAKRQWVYDQIAEGSLIAIRTGRQYRIHPDDLTTFIEINRAA